MRTDTSVHQNRTQLISSKFSSPRGPSSTDPLPLHDLRLQAPQVLLLDERADDAVPDERRIGVPPDALGPVGILHAPGIGSISNVTAVPGMVSTYGFIDRAGSSGSRGGADLAVGLIPAAMAQRTARPIAGEELITCGSVFTCRRVDLAIVALSGSQEDFPEHFPYIFQNIQSPVWLHGLRRVRRHGEPRAIGGSIVLSSQSVMVVFHRSVVSEPPGAPHLWIGRRGPEEATRIRVDPQEPSVSRGLGLMGSCRMVRLPGPVGEDDHAEAKGNRRDGADERPKTKTRT